MRQKLLSLWSNEYLQGGFYLTVASFFINFLNYLFHFVSARVLGPAGYGEITSLYSYISLLSVPFSVISYFIIQKISSREDRRYEYTVGLENFFIKIIKQYWWIFILSFVIVPFIPRITNLTPIIGYSLIPFMILGFTGSFYNSALQGLRLFFIFSFLSAIGGIIKISSIIPAIIIPNNIAGVIIVQLFFSFIMLVVTVRLIHKIIHRKSEKKVSMISKNFKQIITNKYLITTLISVLGISIFSNMDIIFVKKFFTAYDSGIYNSWNLFAKIILYVLGPVSQVVFVFFSDSSQKHMKKRVMLLSLVLLVFIGITGFLAYSFIGRYIINILFGNKFEVILPYLGFSAVFGALYAGITILNSYFLALKSRFSMLLFFLLPLYAVLLFFSAEHLVNIMIVNIIFSSLLTFIYLSAFFFRKNSV